METEEQRAERRDGDHGDQIEGDIVEASPQPGGGHVGRKKGRAQKDIHMSLLCTRTPKLSGRCAKVGVSQSAECFEVTSAASGCDWWELDEGRRSRYADQAARIEAEAEFPAIPPRPPRCSRAYQSTIP